MTYRLIFAKSAKDDIGRLDAVIQKRLSKKLAQVAALADVTLVAKILTGNLGGVYRIRVGDYRVLFVLEGGNINILRVQHRKDVYR
jgi:mRNA interferase RelE/StbE